MAVSSPSLSPVETRLRLSRLETKLVRALHQHPGCLSRRAEHQLRYALSLAQLGLFQPGAAAAGRRLTGRDDVLVEHPRLDRFRRSVLEHLGPELKRTSSSPRHLRRLAAELVHVLPAAADTRQVLIDRYAHLFSARELDEEVGIKTLVNIAGGGGGAGYVYVGAWEELEHAGFVPGYVMGSSIGSVLGLFRARARRGDFEGHLQLAKSLRSADLFRYVSLRTRYGLPGIMRLFMHPSFNATFSHPDGTTLRLSDLEIPFEPIVAGVRRGAMQETPEEYARSHHLHEDRRPGPLQLRAQIASQLVRMAAFVNPLVVREIVLGADALTRDLDCIDAIGFSAAVPGILHYDVTDDRSPSHRILPSLMEREEVVALVDGGVANNVPARTAYRRVQEGVIGTRNAHILGFDCLHPQLTMGHLWLQPVTQALQLQVSWNRRYMHQLVRFAPTLSPINLLPKPARLDAAVAWGRQQMAAEVPLIRKFLEPVEWSDKLAR